MNNSFKKIVMAISLATALFCGSFAAVDAYAQKLKAEECAAQKEGNAYVIRDYQGYVAVFVESDPSCPMTVTEIEVSTLRELDRLLIETGMKIKGHEKLIMTLEDLGS